MEIIPPHRFVVGIRESMNIMCLLSTSRYSKKANSLTSFCYLPRVREKTGSAELRTRRQTQFPIIWVGLRKGQVRVAELPAPSAQARPPGQLPASWLCHGSVPLRMTRVPMILYPGLFTDKSASIAGEQRNPSLTEMVY